MVDQVAPSSILLLSVEVSATSPIANILTAALLRDTSKNSVFVYPELSAVNVSEASGLYSRSTAPPLSAVLFTSP